MVCHAILKPTNNNSAQTLFKTSHPEIIIHRFLAGDRLRVTPPLVKWLPAQEYEKQFSL